MPAIEMHSLVQMISQLPEEHREAALKIANTACLNTLASITQTALQAGGPAHLNDSFLATFQVFLKGEANEDLTAAVANHIQNKEN